ncbi:MAG: HisA/HisF-related TIM barrel protein, partial [Chloroflexota bacterium]|nr:HisA/HisF-related TIM barrel protein [Chloroflexota bacterium]
VHSDLVTEICRLASDIAPSARVECGGGLRDLGSVAAMLKMGVHEVVLGSAAVNDPTFLAQAAERWPGRVGAALDLRAGRPAVDGWTGERAAAPFELATQLLEGGASRLVVTDITRDGTGAGPNLQLMAAFRARFPKAVLVAAGGVGTTAHLAALARLELDGAIVGRALLDGSLDIGEALAACAGEVFA